MHKEIKIYGLEKSPTSDALDKAENQGELMQKETEQESEKLTPKQEAFCVFFTTIGVDEFGNGTKSAIAASYSENGASARASMLLAKDKIRQRISELYQENLKRNNVTVDSVLANIQHDRLMARNRNQLAVAIRADELEGKYLEMFTDKYRDESGEIKELTPEQTAAGEAAAKVYVDTLMKLQREKGKNGPKTVKMPNAG